MRIRLRALAALGALVVVGGWVAPASSGLAAPAPKATVHTVDSKDGRMILRSFPPAKPGTPRPSASQIRSMVAAQPLDCGENGTCIECDLFAWAPQAADTIVTYEAAVYCFYPDMDYFPAIVTEIDLGMIISFGDSVFSGIPLKNAFYSRQSVDHLDIIDAAPCAGPGDYFQTVTATVFFPECCPT